MTRASSLKRRCRLVAGWIDVPILTRRGHKVAKQVDARLRITSPNLCPQCGRSADEFRNTNSFQTHKSRCRVRPAVDTASLAVEHAVAASVETYRVDAEQAGSEWDACHEGQDSMSSSEWLRGKLPLPARDILTRYTLSDGSEYCNISECADTYQDCPEFNKVTRRITEDLDTSQVIQDLDFEVSAAASAVVNQQKVRGVDLEVTLISEEARVEFANAAAGKKKKVTRNTLEPLTIKEALNGPDADKWGPSIEEEWNALVDQ